MAAIVNKIGSLDTKITSLTEELYTYRIQTENRLKKLEKVVATLTNKMDELGNTFDAVFVDEDGPQGQGANETSEAINSSLAEIATTIELLEDGSRLVRGDRREEMEINGFRVIGTVSRGTEIFLRMKQ